MFSSKFVSVPRGRRLTGRPQRGTASRRYRSEAGDTLIEILIALTIITLTAAALLGAFTTSISASADHRNFAKLDAVLKTFVETIQQDLGQQTTSSPKFDTACDGLTGTNGYSNSTGTNYLALTQGTNPTYQASITAIQYWELGNTQYTGPEPWSQPPTTTTPASGFCLTTPPPQAQLLTATVTNQTNHVSESVEVAVSDPMYLPAPASAPSWNGNFTDSVSAGTNNTYTVQASGTPTPALSITGSGNPSWVSLTDNGGGNGTLVIDPPSGTASGNYPVTLTATNSYNNGTSVNQTFTVTVTQAPAFTSATTDTVAPGTAFNWTVTASGTPTPSLSYTPPLPANVSFVDNGNGTGTLSGTSAVASGVYTITFGAMNSSGSATQTFTLTVSSTSPPSFTSSTSDSVPYNEFFSFSVTASGAPSPTITETGALPTGVTFTTGTGTATLSGTPTDLTPTIAVPYTVTFTATSTAGSVQQTFTLTVQAQSQPTISSPTTANPAQVHKNGTRSFTVTGTGFVSGATATSTGMTNVLVTFTNSTTITITGNVANTTGSYTFTITNPDGGKVTSQSNALLVIN